MKPGLRLADFTVPWVASGHCDCVGTNERDRYAYYHEKQDRERQDREEQERAGP
jgi:hypothetical protein